jgi:hypothetical protein
VTVYTLQANMTRGELSPLLHARADIEHYSAGLEEARNVVVTRFGGVTRCPGTLHGGEAKSQVLADVTRFIPFRFNKDQVYAIEAGNLYFRFWLMTDGVPAQVVSGTPVEVVTTYATADLPNLKVQQDGDIIYIFCDGYQPRTLTRNSETSWTLATYTTEDGPYLPINTTSTYLTPADTGNAVAQMTSNTAPSAYVASTSNGTSDAWKMFNRSIGPTVTLDTASSGWLKIDLGTGNAKTVDAYSLSSHDNQNSNGDMFESWTLKGSNDDATWIDLDTRNAETGWTSAETRFYTFVNYVAYRYYRLDFTGGGGDGGVNSKASELMLHQLATEQTAFNLTASSTTGINDDAGFQTTDVGRSIRLFGGDGRWRWAKIISRTSTTVVTIQLYGWALPNTSPILLWRLGAWSDESGWPKAVALYEDRLVGAGTDADPIAGWASKSALYDDHGLSDPLVDDDAVSWRLTGGELNQVEWLSSGRDLLIGTAGSLRAVGRADNNKAFSPTNVRQRNETSISASGADPVTIENTTLLIDSNKTRLYEAAYTYETEGYQAQEASTLNEHLYAIGVEEIAYQEHPHKIVWGRRTDGKLIASTYDRKEKVFGSTLVDVGGVVESILTLPGDGRSDLFMIVRRTVDGATVRYVEGLAEFWSGDTTSQEVPVYSSCSLIYDGVATNTVSGLDHIEGETVGVWADGLDFEGLVVTSGAITLPNSITATQIVVGCRMAWNVKTLRVTSWGNKDGSGLGRKTEIGNAYIDLYEAAGVEVGTASAVYDFQYEDAIDQDPFDPMPLRTGMYKMAVEDSWKNTGQCIVQGDRMYPATIRAITLEIEGEP